jgi:uncharacterized membrane protein
MASLFFAALTFTGLHLLISGTRLRGTLVRRVGERGFAALFSLASVASLVWLVHAYVRVRAPAITPMADLRGVADALVLVAFVFMTLGLLARSPTAVGGERLLTQPEHPADLARGIHRVTRHPFLWGIALWAAVHAVFNPGLAHALFFGTFVVVGLAGTVSIDRKRALKLGDAWQRYAALTSNLPFAAIARGRNRLVWRELGLLKLLAALVVFALVAAFHARLFGVPAV